MQAVRSGYPEEPNLIGQHIAGSSCILAAVPAYPERHGSPSSLADVAQHQCLLFRDRNEAFGVWPLKGARGFEDVCVSGGVASNDKDFVPGWAHDMIAAEQFVAKSLEPGKPVRVLPTWHQPVDVWAMPTSSTSESVKVRLLGEYLKAEMAVPG